MTLSNNTNKCSFDLDARGLIVSNYNCRISREAYSRTIQLVSLSVSAVLRSWAGVSS